jgi:serine protease Do
MRGRALFRGPAGRMRGVAARGLVALLLTAAWAAGPVANAPAQAVFQAGLERHRPVSPEKRAELYRQLHTEAEYFQRQAALLKTVARLVGPAVVHVEADVSQRAALHVGHGRQVEENGSGVIIEQAGKQYILSSRHIIVGAQPGAVRIDLADGRRIQPQRIWDDRDTDVAVMAVSAEGMVAAPLGSSRELDVGDFVLAIGNPFGLSNSVTFGIISAKARRNLDLGDSGIRLQEFLQTDAAINPGNSGGPLVNLRGEVIGINTCIASNSGGNEGIAFAIPIDMFMTVARQLIAHGKVSRAFLGVELDPAFGPNAAAEAGLPRPMGARVTKVSDNSPAAAVQVRKGDVILQFNDTPVESDNHLINMVNFAEIGKQVSLLVYRDRRTFTVKTAVTDRDLVPKPPE